MSSPLASSFLLVLDDVKHGRLSLNPMTLEVYLVLWTSVTLVNMLFGIARAGYGFLKSSFFDLLYGRHLDCWRFGY